jgi:hypothetical protein
VIGDLRPHDPPAVPEQELVLHAVGELRDDVGSDEPLPADRRADVDAVRGDVDLAPSMRAPGFRSGHERCARPVLDVVRVERPAPGLELGVESPPAAVLQHLDDDVVVVPAGMEVGREADTAPGRNAVVAKRPDAHQRVVAAAALHALGEGARLGERLPVRL